MNPLNLSSQQVYNIFEVLQSAHVVKKDTEGYISYLNNYIDWNQFNQLYDPKYQVKEIRSANVIVRNLMPVSRKVIKQRQGAVT